MGERNSYPGGCHCGALSFTFRTERAPTEWTVRACQCTFCRAHDALSTSDPQGEIEFAAHRPEALQRYQFGQRTADFLLCRECGVYLGAVMDLPEGRYGIVNVHAFKPVPEGVPGPAPMSYEGESSADRGARRQQRWSPVKSTGRS